MSLSHPTSAVDTIALAVSDAAGAARFLTETLDFSLDEPASPTSCPRLRLGGETLVLDERRPPGRPAPVDTRSNDLWFQHLAVVVSDMDAAHERLRAAGVDHISPAPQRLPVWNPAAGGIRAFYFRGPDGHPLELISYPPGKGDERWQSTGRLFLGIDHTAIVVSSTDASLRFYQHGLGLDVTGRSENWGPEQERLSGVTGARVQITSLRGAGGPGVEFLEYLAPSTGRPRPADSGPDDLWNVETLVTTPDLDGVLHRLVSTVPGIDVSRGGAGLLVRDPDGHAVRISEAG